MQQQRQTYAVIFTDTSGSTHAELTDELHAALDIVATIRTQGGQVLGLFQELPGRIVLTARFEPAQDPGTPVTAVAPTSHPVRRPVRLAVPDDSAPAHKPLSRKRSVRQLQAMARKVTQFVKHHPGATVEQIGRAIHSSTPQLRTPLARLLESGALTKTGTRRYTRYYAASASAKPLA